MTSAKELIDSDWPDTSDWGAYAPKGNTSFLRLLVKLGISRGKVRKMILKSWRKKHGTVVDQEVRGVKYRLDFKDNPIDAKLIASSTIYDKQEISSLKQAIPHGPVLDIGGNMGYYALTLAHAGFEVISFEPNPPAQARLKYNISLNTFKDRITLLPIGIGAEGEMTFYQTGDLGTASLVKPTHKECTEIKIKTMPLLQVVEDLGIKKLGAIKIDIEGYEDQALVPFMKEAPDTLMPYMVAVEDCHKHLWKEDLLQAIESRGFKVVLDTRGNKIYQRIKK